MTAKTTKTARSKRIMAALLTVAMLIGVCPATVWAETVDDSVNKISVTLSTIGDGGEFYFTGTPGQHTMSFQELSTNYYGRVSIIIQAYPGYYVKSVKLNGEPWNSTINPFYDTPTLKNNLSLSNTENFVREFTFTPTQNSVLEVEFGAADILTIEYGENIPVYADFNDETLWHEDGKYYVSESNRTLLCDFHAIRDPEYTQSVYYLNTKPDGSGYNLGTTEIRGGNFLWDPTVDELAQYVNGVSEEITVYAILQCNSHWSTEKELYWEYIDAVEPTCDQPGNLAYRHCTVCDAYQIVSNQDDWDVRHYPEDGSTVYYKRVIKADVFLDALEHDYSKYTNNNDGTHTVACTLCGDTKTESHELVDGVCVCGEGNCLPGDVNGDGAFDLLDVLLMQQSLAGWEVELDSDAGDVNDDGAADLLDVLLMQQSLAGWDVALK